ncbi:hypothetical protein Q7P36_005426 [Cladosporium allicinum]
MPFWPPFSDELYDVLTSNITHSGVCHNFPAFYYEQKVLLWRNYNRLPDHLSPYKPKRENFRNNMRSMTKK